MSPEVLGAAMTRDIRIWEKDQRRVGSLLVLGAAALVLLAAIVAYAAMGVRTPILYWTLVVLLLLLLLFEGAVFTMKPRPAETASTGAHLGPAGPGVTSSEPAPQSRVLTLRCGDCSTVFDVTDTGERPLYHTCPGCGAEGMLKGEPTPPSQPAPSPSYGSPYAPPPAQAVEAPTPPEEREPTSPMIAAPPEPAPVRRLKLRCGGCREVFSIDDSGERPLRRPCPHCGRVGEIR